MQTSDVNNNANGRMDIIKDNSSPKPSKEARKADLPANVYQGKNSDGYDIIPDERK